MKTGTAESEAPGIVPKLEPGLEAEEVEESIDIVQDQSNSAKNRAAVRPRGRRDRVERWTSRLDDSAQKLGQWKG